MDKELAARIFALAVIVPGLVVAVAILAMVLPAFRHLGSLFKGRAAGAGMVPAMAGAGGPIVTVAPKDGYGTQFWN